MMRGSKQKNGHATEKLIDETRRLKRQLEAMTIRLDTFYKQLQREVDRLQTISDAKDEGNG